MEFGKTCSICKDNEGLLRVFKVKPKPPHDTITMYRVICDECMEPNEDGTIEDYLKFLNEQEKVTYVGNHKEILTIPEAITRAYCGW